VTDPVKITLNPVFRYLGAAIFIFGVILFVVSLAKIKKFENYHGELITNGIYRFLRHPMYLSFVFWMVGSSLFNQSGVACLMTIIFTVNIFIWKKLEEIQLQKIFPAYKEYMKRTYF
jgi:protein-S-isoprenylcysteine O-methyltransferase Ste14